MPVKDDDHLPFLRLLLVVHCRLLIDVDIGSSIATSSFGIVGTVVLWGKFVVLWFGWGNIKMIRGSNQCVSCSSSIPTMTKTKMYTNAAMSFSSIGNGAPLMGPLALSMHSKDNTILAQQMSAMITRRVRWPIFVWMEFSHLVWYHVWRGGNQHVQC